MNFEHPSNTLALNIKTTDIERLTSADFWQQTLGEQYRDLIVDYRGGCSLIIRSQHKAVFITVSERLEDFLADDYDSYLKTDGGGIRNMIMIVTPSRYDTLLSGHNKNLLNNLNIPLMELKAPHALNDYGKQLYALQKYSSPDDNNPFNRFIYDLSKEIIIALIIRFLLG